MLRLALALTLLALAPDTQMPVREIGDHEGSVLQILFGPKGKRLYTAGADGTLVAWDVAKSARLWEHRTGPGGTAPGNIVPFSVVGFGMLSKNELVYTTGGVVVVTVVDSTNGKQRAAVGGPNPLERSTAFAADPKGRFAWIGTDTGLVFRLNPDDVNAWSRRKVGGGTVTCLAADGGGKWLAIGGQDGRIRLMKAGNAKLEDKPIEKHEGSVRALVYAAKGKTLISGSDDKTVRMWNPGRRREIRSLAGHGAAVLAVAVDPKRKWIASGDEDGVVRLWRFKDGAAAQDWKEQGPVASLSFAPDGKTLATAGSDGRVRLWDLTDL